MKKREVRRMIRSRKGSLVMQGNFVSYFLLPVLNIVTDIVEG